LVRTNVLKNKDAGSIIKELDKLDEMEFGGIIVGQVGQQGQVGHQDEGGHGGHGGHIVTSQQQQQIISDKVIKDKRRKLKETFERMVRFYVRWKNEFFVFRYFDLCCPLTFDEL